jgi:hypothetical protein
VRFASVYREFRDVEEFVAELQIPQAQGDDPNSLTFSFTGFPLEGSDAPMKAEDKT